MPSHQKEVKFYGRNSNNKCPGHRDTARAGYGRSTEYYSGRDDLPDEYRIFAYPDPPEKMSIRAQLELYGSMAAAQTVTARPVPALDAAR